MRNDQHQFVLPIDVPRVPSGVSIPQYYQMNLVVTGPTTTESISAGTLIGSGGVETVYNGGTAAGVTIEGGGMSPAAMVLVVVLLLCCDAAAESGAADEAGAALWSLITTL